MLKETVTAPEDLGAKPLRTLIVGASREDGTAVKLREVIGSCRGFPAPGFASFADAEQSCSRVKPELAAVCLSGDPDHDEESIRLLRRVMADGYVLAIGYISDPKVILRSLQVGADAYVDRDDLETEFAAAVCRLTSKQEVKSRAGRLLAVVPSSGGCGASTLSVNLAAAIARDRGKCALVDLNPGRGDLAALLDMKPRFTLADVCLNEARLDRAMLEKSLSRHSSGVHLLGAPVELGDIRSVTPGGVRQALSLARKLFPDTVVDLEDCFHVEQTEVLTRATSVFVVCRLDFTSVRHARRILDHLAKADVPRGQVKVVVNQHGRPGDLPVAEAEEALGAKVAAFIPYDPKTILAANNTGLPTVLKDPDTKLSLAVAELAGVRFAKPSGKSGFFLKLRLF